MFNGTQWQRCTLVTGLAFPAVVFGTFFFVNFFVWHSGSANAMPFGSMMVVLVLWLLVSLPLVFVGAYYGFKREKISVPVRGQQLSVAWRWPGHLSSSQD